MKPSSTIKGIALAIGLLALAFDGSAATLGRMQGAALIGQPLNLSVQVQLGDGEDAASPCLEAEVFHADNRQDPGRIRVTLESIAQTQSGVVRIVSSTPVDEPLVTVYLRAGCSQKSSRRYVLLADLVSDVLAPVAAPARPAVLPSAVAAPRAVTTVVANAAAARSDPMSVASLPAAKRVVRAAKAAPVESASREIKGRVAKTRTKSRLKLDVLDLSQERDPVLKASVELLSTPTDNVQRRAEAAALWRALNASPEDILRDGARVQAMDADITALKTITVRNQVGLKDLATRLRRAESERYANWLVYLLTTLLLLSVLTVAWLWRRHQSAPHQDWWRESELRASASGSVLPEAVDTSRSTVVSQRAALAPALTEVDIDLGAAPAAVGTAVAKVRAQAVPLPTALPRTSAAPGFGVSTGGHLRDIDTQELVDIRHQAEFFMSLGQHEQAIEVLEHRLEENGESSPLVFLDLLGILHTLGRKPEYDVVRSEFKQLFTGKAPAFTDFSEGGQTLDAYPDVVRRITALWPTARVLEFMEDCIFRNPGDESGPSFDMAAFHELLLLHGVAKRIVRVSALGAESKSVGLMRSPFKTNTTPVPVEASRRGLGSPTAEATVSAVPISMGRLRPDDDGAMLHFSLPDSR